jgi:hypothetical protein
VVNNETVAGLAIETVEVFDTGTIIGALDDKTKINGDALLAHRGMTGGLDTTSSLAKFSLGANGT